MKLNFKEFYEPGIWELFSKIRNGDHSLVEPFKASFSKAHTYDHKRAAMFVDAMRDHIQQGTSNDGWQELETELRHILNTESI